MSPVHLSFLILLGEMLVVGLSVLAIYALRRPLGLAPLFCFVGALQAVMYAYTGNGQVDFPFGVTVMPASFVLFSGLLFSILLLYVCEGTPVARRLILCMIGVNVFYVWYDHVHVFQMLAPFTHRADASGPLPGFAPWRMVLSSGVAIVIDFFLLVVAYQFLVNNARWIPEWLRLFLAFLLTTLVDVLLFNTGAFYGRPEYVEILRGQVVSKPVAAAVYTALLAAFVARERRRAAGATPSPERGVLDVFGYKTRYEETARRLRASEQAKKELEDMNLRLRATDRMKTQFLANMSHELRSPLNDILGFTDVLLQELPGPLLAEQRQQLGIVASSSRHLLALINDLLDLSRVEAGRMAVDPAPVNLSTVLREMDERYRPSTAQKGLSLVVPEPPPFALVTDEFRLKQILINLLSNAVKFTDEGEIRVECRTADGRLELGVEDTGPGIRAEEQPLLFQEFRQLDGSHRRAHEGTGLGLALSRKLARLLGGDLTVESVPGRGSRFLLQLPLSSAPVPAKAKAGG
ncbi:MAG: VUT family protein [Planctomycetes bacterium]|nr:VUT family protein [Planctomycetota bacterium]